jgi:transcriptional regulator GlxA family with amidase domain
VPLFREFFRKIQLKGCSSLGAACHWQSLLAEIVTTQPKPVGKPIAWLEQALDLLEHSAPDSATSLQEVAKACGIGYESFRKKFEQALGVPPGRYVLARRIERARRLITIENFTNKEIAELLGFYDEFHFSKVFTRFSGKTPRQFRRSLSERR